MPTYATETKRVQVKRDAEPADIRKIMGAKATLLQAIREYRPARSVTPPASNSSPKAPGAGEPGRQGTRPRWRRGRPATARRDQQRHAQRPLGNADAERVGRPAQVGSCPPAAQLAAPAPAAQHRALRSPRLCLLARLSTARAGDGRAGTSRRASRGSLLTDPCPHGGLTPGGGGGALPGARWCPEPSSRRPATGGSAPMHHAPGGGGGGGQWLTRGHP